MERGLLAGERGAGQRVGEALAWLEQRGMLREGEDGVYAPTLLGKGAYVAAMPIETALRVYKDLQRCAPEPFLRLFFILFVGGGVRSRERFEKERAWKGRESELCAADSAHG